ncbi:MAG: hypothetical protein KF754_00735 [Planctomycetes bacterium]|nr:hypothetical protein [Planctomycetota bacterium]
MTFQLGVWHADKPLSLGAAGELFDRVSEGKDPGLKPAPAMKAFFNQLLLRYPTLDNWPTEDVTECPWEEQPRFSPQYLIFTLMAAHSEQLEAVIVDMALEHGMTVYDPQTPDLHMPPSLEDQTFWRLETLSNELVEPSPEDTQAALKDLKDDGESYVLLSQCATAYIQAVLDQGEYVVEYRDKDTGELFQAINKDLAPVSAAFAAYRTGHAAWKKSLAWEAVE